jgi:hypothetical protein
MSVVPPGDDHDVSTQLRLVEPPERRKKATRATKRAAPRRGRVVGASRGRRVRWDTDWRLDAATRQVGREGVAAAREALARAESDRLREAS